MRPSRPSLLRTLGLSGLAAVGGAKAVSAAPLESEIEGCVSWCNAPRGILKFLPLRADAAERLIMLEILDEETIWRLRKSARPVQPLVLHVRWRPDVDVLAPWQAVAVVFSSGERFEARQGISNIS